MTNFNQKGHTVGTQYNADTNIIGVPFETWKADLAEKQTRIEELLVSSTISETEKKFYKQRLHEVESQRQDEQGSYQAHIQDLKERISQLDKLSDQVPHKLIDDAKQALAKGNNDQAKQLFIQIEEQADPHIAAAAEAAYQRGKLAEDNINYNEAFEHYHRATQLSPDNTLYLNNEGNISNTLGLFNHSIMYFESALAYDLKTYDDGHPSVARDHNNLGLAWKTLGQTEKAITYFELALASDLKNYDEDHPSVATKRNNLGAALKTLGQTEKAITYFELALASNIKTYDEYHPSVAIDRNNLGTALYELGQIEKAITYFELALASDLKNYNKNHPRVAIDFSNLGSAWKGLDQKEKTITYYDLALTVCKNSLGKSHPTTKTIADNLAKAKT